MASKCLSFVSVCEYLGLHKINLKPVNQINNYKVDCALMFEAISSGFQSKYEHQYQANQREESQIGQNNPSGLNHWQNILLYL